MSAERITPAEAVRRGLLSPKSLAGLAAHRAALEEAAGRCFCCDAPLTPEAIAAGQTLCPEHQEATP